MSVWAIPTVAYLASSLILTSCLTPTPVASPVSDNRVSPKGANSATLDGYALEIDGQYTRGVAGSVEIPLGCHVVILSKDPWPRATSRASYLYGFRRDVPRTRYFQFTAKAAHRYVIERNYQYLSDVLPSSRGGGGWWRVEVLTLAELDENGALERRYSESEAHETPLSC